MTTRLRIVLVVLLLSLAGLLARAVQLQWRQHDDWVKAAQKRSETSERIDTSRGRILDRKGRVLAYDAPCVDAVVDYRAIVQPADDEWVREFARERLKSRLGDDYLKAPRQQQKQLIEDQMQQVRADIAAMWPALGEQKTTGATHEQIEERRQQIVRKVEMQRRYKWYTDFVVAQEKQQGKTSHWWQRWLIENSEGGPDIDAFDVEVKEQLASHVVLPAISPDLANYLGKNADRFPGLSIRPGLHRTYPYQEAACQVIGYLSPVNPKDLENDPEPLNELRKYWPYDLIGRGGVEAMCEQTLRGTRGRWKTQVGREAVMDATAENGRDVTLGIDIELQKKIEAAFVQRKIWNGNLDERPLHGAAIVIDIATGEVRAMASYPTYDINTLDQMYLALAKDKISKPLFNRATMSQLEPGSTVKPMVGMAGITEKVVGIHEGIECTGKLKIDGITYDNSGRCWTAKLNPPVSHHHTGSPHQGKYGNPDGFLIFADALERSCNVWPETVAHRLGYARLKEWFGRFGLGRRTGIGIAEASGRLPEPVKGHERATTCFAGMGQGIGATPIQMANVAATIARDGVWMRPKLVAEGFELPTTRPSDERVQLPIDPQAVAEARLGMRNVVNADGGTGKTLARKDMVVAGKTGSAQAAKFSVEDDQKKKRYFEPTTEEWTNPEVPWYRGTAIKTKPGEYELSHAWFIGFVPADHPKIAFAVMVEYGGSGGVVAGPVAQALLDAAVEEGYLAGNVATR